MQDTSGTRVIDKSFTGSFPCNCGRLFLKPQSFQKHWVKCNSNNQRKLQVDNTKQLEKEEYLSNDSIENEFLRVGFRIDNQKLSILCIQCKCLVHFSSLGQHAYRLHKIKEMKSRIENLAKFNPGFLKQIRLQPFKEPIPQVEGLLIYLQNIRDTNCRWLRMPSMYILLLEKKFNSKTYENFSWAKLFGCIWVLQSPMSIQRYSSILQSI